MGLLIGSFLSPLSASESEDTWLKWRNGDELRGSVLPSENSTIRWQAKPFRGPIELNLEQLEGIRFPSTNEIERDEKEPFQIICKNGDRLSGRLVAITSSTIVITCPGLDGPVTLKKNEVERVTHTSSEHLHYSGPSNLGDWISSGRDRKPSEWFTDLRGEFATHQWSGNLFREIELPDRMEVSFSAKFPQGSPNLEIGFLRDAALGPRIETWDNFLVLTYQTRFVPLLELTGETREIEFRFFWNQESGNVKVCDLSGRAIGSLSDVVVARHLREENKSSRTAPLARGFSILNRTPEIKLTNLTVQEWDGNYIPVIDLSRPRLLLRDSPPRFDVSRIRLIEGSETLSAGGRTIPLASIQELIFAPASPTKDDVEASETVTRVAWFDGSNISGAYEKVDAETLTLSPSWAAAPVRAQVGNMREVRFPASDVSIEKGEDQLSGDGFHLHGTARTAATYAEERIGWHPPGAVEPVPLADDIEAQVLRSPFPANRQSLPSLIGRARIYLTNGEVVVGEIESIDAQGARFTSRITGAIRIPSQDIRAIDIGNGGRILEGFDDAEWEEVEENEEEITVADGKALLREGSFGNPSLLLGDRILFDAEWKESYGAMTLRLFASSPAPNTPSTDVIIAAQGNRLFIGKLKESGAFSFSGDQIPIFANKASFEVIASPEKVEVLINGKSSLTVAVEPGDASGNGIYFKMGGGWQGWNQKDNEIELSNFRIERTPGSLPRRVIDPTAKGNALTIPRSQRETLPTHLLIAPNGDLLRGQLEAVDGNSVTFTSKAETVELPRSRVSAIVWLRPAEEEGNPPGGDTLLGNPKDYPATYPVTHQFVLMDGSHLQLQAETVEGNVFIGRSALLNTCRFPIDSIREMHVGAPKPADNWEAIRDPSFEDWNLVLTPDPDIPDGSTGSESPLIGKPAPPISLTNLDGSKFELRGLKGKVVVLDFWATWCGPCIKAMPEVVSAVDAFPLGTVEFTTINQAETNPIIEGFLEKRGWQDIPVALDFAMKASEAYGVENIPFTVVIDQNGTVAWVHSGFSETLRQDLFRVLVGLTAQ